VGEAAAGATAAGAMAAVTAAVAALPPQQRFVFNPAYVPSSDEEEDVGDGSFQMGSGVQASRRHGTVCF
jgi:hypothetical protein